MGVFIFFGGDENVIKFKLINLSQIINVFNNIANKQTNIALSYQILKILKKLGEEKDIFNNTVRMLRNKYCKVDADGNIVLNANGTFQIKDGLEEEYKKEAQEFASLEVELDVDKIRLSQLSNEDIKLSPNELFTIEDFIETDI